MSAESVAAFLPFQQSAPYAAAAAACGARVRWLEVAGARALAVERGRMRLISRGPVFAPDCEGVARRVAVRQLARWPGVTLVTPGPGLTGFGLVPIVTQVHHAVWPLTGDLRDGMAGKWRNRLRQAERAGLDLRQGTTATLAELVAAEAVQRRARGYRALPAAFTLALPGEALRLWEWREAGVLAAAMAFVVHGGSASYHLGWASARARQAGAHAALLARAAASLQAEGVRWLDLGSVDTEASPGLARFKLGTGAALTPLGATFLVLP